MSQFFLRQSLNLYNLQMQDKNMNAYKIFLILILLIGFSSELYGSSEFSIFKKTNGVYYFGDEKDRFEISEYEFEIYKAVINDVHSQIVISSLGVTPEVGKDLYSGQIQIGRNLYRYDFYHGIIDVYDESDSYVSAIPAGRILEYLRQVTKDDTLQAKCPWCLVAIGLQATCSLTEGGSHAYCAATCPCGVASVSTTCVLGYRTTSCSCQTCPLPPNPPRLFPINGDWFGPFMPVTDFGDGPFIVQ